MKLNKSEKAEARRSKREESLKMERLAVYVCEKCPQDPWCHPVGGVSPERLAKRGLPPTTSACPNDCCGNLKGRLVGFYVRENKP